MNNTDENKILKKITVVETNNFVLDCRYNHMPVKESLDTEELKLLREYVLGCADLLSCSDPEIIIKALEWVSSQWKHDGMNEPPKDSTSYEILQNVKKGERYRCVEYGKVMADLLLSLGYISRSVALRSTNVAYGGYGMGHVASEIWSNALGKWVFVDPQFCIYAMYNNQYLNFYDMYKLKTEGLFDKIDFIVPKKYMEMNKIKLSGYVTKYKQFLINYFGHMSVQYIRDGIKSSLVLLLDNQKPCLTFQGVGQSETLFTQRPEDLYYSINNTSITFEYKGKTNFQDIFSKYPIKTNKSYIKYMPCFAAKPNYILHFQNNMKWFSHYEVKENDNEWIRIDSNNYEWELSEGMNTITVRGVNEGGNRGIPCFIKIRYSVED